MCVQETGLDSKAARGTFRNHTSPRRIIIFIWILLLLYSGIFIPIKLDNNDMFHGSTDHGSVEVFYHVHFKTQETMNTSEFDCTNFSKCFPLKHRDHNARSVHCEVLSLRTLDSKLNCETMSVNIEQYNNCRQHLEYIAQTHAF